MGSTAIPTKSAAAALLACVLVAQFAAAQEQLGIYRSAPPASSVPRSLVNETSSWDGASRLRFQALAGFSESTSLGPEADFDYELVSLRAECVLLPDHDPAFLPQGDFTCLADLMIADPEDFGSIIVGPSILLRKELRPSTARLIPYAQAGGGMVYTDADNRQSQRVIGRSWEFLLQAGLGCHYRVNDDWMLDLEGSYQHISNARLAARNLGSNNVGVVVGFTREFGPIHR